MFPIGYCETEFDNVERSFNRLNFYEKLKELCSLIEPARQQFKKSIFAAESVNYVRVCILRLITRRGVKYIFDNVKNLDAKLFWQIVVSVDIRNFP